MEKETIGLTERIYITHITYHEENMKNIGYGDAFHIHHLNCDVEFQGEKKRNVKFICFTGQYESIVENGYCTLEQKSIAEEKAMEDINIKAKTNE